MNDDSSSLNSTVDDVLDNTRFFAEASDRLEAIDVMADIYDDLGMVLIRLIQEIRDDYGKSVALPLWLIDNYEKIEKPEGNLLAPEKHSCLVQSNLPLLYHGVVEHNDIIMTLSDRHCKQNNSSKLDSIQLYANLLNTMLGFRESSGNDNSDSTSISSTQEFIDNTRSYRKFPLAVVEAWDSAISYSNMSEEFIVEQLAVLKGSSTGDVSCEGFMLNPFLTLMSAVKLPASCLYQRPYTNLLSVQGSEIDNIPRKLFLECLDSKYKVTGCVQLYSATNSTYRLV